MTKAATKPATSTIKNVHEAIVHVMNQVGYVQKQDADGLPYSIASEAAFIKAVRPHMVEIGLFIYQRDVQEIVTETFLTSNTKTAHKRIFKFEYAFYHAPSQTELGVTSIGEGDDFSDKGSNKAMTIALKYALRQTLLIETGDDPDKTPSSLLAQAKKLGGEIWSEEHIQAAKAGNPGASEEQLENALNMFCDVTGWTPETPANDFKLLAEKYLKQKTIAEQDGDSPGFRILVKLAFQEYNSEID